MAVPQLRIPTFSSLIGEILVDRYDTFAPHAFAVRVTEKQRALQNVFVITVDSTADVTVSVGPNAGLDIDPFTDQPNLRSTIVSFDERALGLLVKHGLTSEFA